MERSLAYDYKSILKIIQKEIHLYYSHIVTQNYSYNSNTKHYVWSEKFEDLNDWDVRYYLTGALKVSDDFRVPFIY